MNHPVSLADAQATVDGWMKQYLGDRAIPVHVRFIETQEDISWARTDTNPNGPIMEILPMMQVLDKGRWLEILKHETAHAIENVRRFEEVGRDLDRYMRRIDLDGMMAIFTGSVPGHEPDWRKQYESMGGTGSTIERVTLEDFRRLDKVKFPIAPNVQRALDDARRAYGQPPL